MYVDNHYRQQEIYASAAHLFTIYPWWSMSLSNDFQWNTLRADLIDFVYPTRNTILTSAATSFDLSLIHIFESAHRIGRTTSYRYAQYPVERQLGDAFHTKLHGTIGN